MSAFKVQRIRSCVQCGTVLSVKCKGCAAHPDRKPRVVEYFGWPEILQVCPCKCSVMLRCQRVGCANTMWRNKTHNHNGLSRSANLYCSKRCNLVTLNATKDTTVMVPCGWHECKKPVRRRAAMLKTFKSAYCRPDHYFLAMRKAIHDKKEDAKRAMASLRVQVKACYGKCRGEITDHELLPNGMFECAACHTKSREASMRVESTLSRASGRA